MEGIESMRYLWAPWRMHYILGEKKKGCFFCNDLKEKNQNKNLNLYQGRYVFVVMNRYPYNNGHLMIVPKRHRLNLEDLNREELKEFFELLKLCIRVLKAALRPSGFNVGMNIGKAGGAGEDHVHLHVVPRWEGDTNFMPVIGEARVIPEYLEKTYQKLHDAFMDFSRKGKMPKGG